MFAEKSLQISLVLSIAVHTAVLLNYPDLGPLPFRKRPEMVQIKYMKAPPQLTEEQKIMLQQKLPAIQHTAKVAALSKEKLSPPAHKDGILNKTRLAAAQDSPLVKPSLTKPDIIAVKKKITLPAVDLEKINNPTYVSYYQFVREKIRRAAYQHYTRTETGEIYLAFVITSDGLLQDVRLIEDRSASNGYLRDIALRSIRGAAPFPPFPKELDYPRLSFNVIISFEIE